MGLEHLGGVDAVYDLPTDQQATIVGLIRARRDEDGAFFASSPMSAHDRLLLANKAAKAGAKPTTPAADPQLQEFMDLAGISR